MLGAGPLTREASLPAPPQPLQGHRAGPPTRADLPGAPQPRAPVHLPPPGLPPAQASSRQAEAEAAHGHCWDPGRGPAAPSPASSRGSLGLTLWCPPSLGPGRA